MYAKIYPRTNISKAYYRHLIKKIEADPLIRHTTIATACLFAAMSVLAGAFIWFAKANPGNLIQTSGTVTSVTSGRTDHIGTVTTFVLFDFTTRDDRKIGARQAVTDGLEYQEGQIIKVGYHPRNPNYVRNLTDNRPPAVAIVLWFAPLVLLIWFSFVALFRHHKRQLLIWDAADAADAED